MHKGSCLCGGITFTVDVDITKVSHCHCSMCRKAHGAVFATYAIVDESDYHLHDPQHLLRQFQSSSNVTRSFCSVCGSPLRWHQTGARENLVEFPVSALDTTLVEVEQRDIFTEGKVGWYTSIHK